MLNTSRTLTIYDRKSLTRHASLLKPFRSTNNSPVATERGRSRQNVTQSSFNSAIKENHLNASQRIHIKKSLNVLKDGQKMLKEDHQFFRKEFVKLLGKLKDIFSENNAKSSLKMTSQSVEKVHQLISELDSTRFSQKKKIEEKDNKIKELYQMIKEKDQEVFTAQKYIEMQKEELKSKEKYILKVEKHTVEIKHKCQQDINRVENEKSSLENHYLHELTLLKSEREEARSRLTQQFLREKDISTRLLGGSVSKSLVHEHYDVLLQEIEILKGERNTFSTQLHNQQDIIRSLDDEKAQLKKCLEENQDLLKELENRIDFLSQELKTSMEAKESLNSLLDEEKTQLIEAQKQLHEKSAQLEDQALKLEKTNEQLDECMNQYELIIKQVSAWDLKKIQSVGQKNSWKSLKEDFSSNPNSASRVISHRAKMSVPSSKENSPLASHKRGAMEYSFRNVTDVFSKEGELQDKLISVEQIQKESRNRNELLKIETQAFTKKLSSRDKEVSQLKQEVLNLKEKLKSASSSATNFDFLKNEIQKYKKSSQEFEEDLKKARLEIRKLNIVKDDLEATIKDQVMKGQLSENEYFNNLKSDLSLDGKQVVICNQCQVYASNIHKDQSERAKIDKLHDEEIRFVKQINEELSEKLTAGEAKIQNIMRLSANTIKTITEEFLKLASSTFSSLNERIQKESTKWDRLERLLRKLILKYIHLQSQTRISGSSPDEVYSKNTTVKGRSSSERNSFKSYKSTLNAEKQNVKKTKDKFQGLRSSKDKKDNNTHQLDRNNQDKDDFLSTSNVLDESSFDSLSSKNNSNSYFSNKTMQESHMEKYNIGDVKTNPVLKDLQVSDSNHQAYSQHRMSGLSEANFPFDKITIGYLEGIKEAERETDTLQDEFAVDEKI